MSKQDKPKILVIDIEWRPALAYVWQMWKVNINPAMLLDHGGMLCFCAHWHGEKKYMFYSEWADGREGMAEAARDLLIEADLVVHYNGDKYDLPKITGEIVLAGLTPPPKPASVDLMKVVKGFGFNMNRMSYVAPLLGVDNKMEHEGFALWRDVMDGCAKAQKKMEKYNKQDVKVTAQMYDRLLPFIRNHPHLRATVGGTDCPACGGTHTQKRGSRTTRMFKVQRNQCQDCGHWFETTRTKVKNEAT